MSAQQTTAPEDLALRGNVLPEHLIERARFYGERGGQVALVVRHAERAAVVDFGKHEEARLTPRGHAQALAAGASLTRLLPHPFARVRLHHSTVPRCEETAQGVCFGVGDARIEAAHDELAAPFIKDRHRTNKLVMQHGFLPFLRDWFDGRLPSQLVDDRATAASVQVRRVALTLLPDELSVCVTHDWNIVLVKEHFLALKPEDGWPHFLDGYVLARLGDDYVIDYAGNAQAIAAPP